MPSFIVSIYRWLDTNAEKSVSVVAYAACAGIIAVEVFRRYIFDQQAPWSTFVPSYMFLWLTWLGASYCTKRRSHLVFNELRERMPRKWQYILVQLDYVMFAVFGVIVIYWSFDLVQLHYEMESIVPGTDDVMSWWFYSATPVGWTMLLYRVCQNIVEDYKDLVSGAEIKIKGASMVID
jgi:TRAP-type C4-dicarboxylate transport system permease small subunit